MSLVSSSTAEVISCRESKRIAEVAEWGFRSFLFDNSAPVVLNGHPEQAMAFVVAALSCFVRVSGTADITRSYHFPICLHCLPGTARGLFEGACH